MSELRPWFGKPPHAIAPDMPGYRQVAHERLSVGSLTVAGLVLIPVWAVVFTAVVGILGGRTSYSATFQFLGLFLIIALVVGVILVHEAIHGLVAALLGTRPSFGVGPGFAYTTFLDPMSKAAYLAVGLAPLVLMSIVALIVALAWPALAGWMIAAAVINASGAIGDLWMTVRILRSPAGARFHDLADGFAVYVPE